TAFALNLKTPKKLADPDAHEEDGRNGVLNTNSSPDSVPPKSSNMDENAVSGTVPISNKGKLVDRIRACLYAESIAEIDKENEQPIDDREKAVRAENHDESMVNHKTAAMEEDVEDRQ